MTHRALFLLGGLTALLIVVALSVQASAAGPNELPLSSADIATARGAPIAVGGKETLTTTWGTTPAALFTTDLSTTNRVKTRYVQNVRVTNRHATQTLCVFDLPWHASNTCAVQCAASGRTCSGASTDGAPILAGTTWSEAWTGTACLCAVGSAASTTATAERVQRLPQ
jgi:hypothetical protein